MADDTPSNDTSDSPPNAGAPPVDMNSSQAADLIRDKVARIYADEPSAASELAEAKVITPRSKHQQFMHDLSASGKDLATIQTEWHNYYINLPTNEKHQVWQEFYDSNVTVPTAQVAPGAAAATDPAQALSQHKHQVVSKGRVRPTVKSPKLRDVRSAQDISIAIRDKVTAGGKLQAKHHLQSLFFGLGIGALVLFIFLFSFFNEFIIAPFIQPSRVAAATPIIVGVNSVAPTATPEIIIPKINVEIPVNYSETSTNEATIENDLESGAVHYPTTVLPGQQGNAAFFGHSSNNILNPGKYKFAFVLLHTLVPGDTFYLTYNDQVYVYKIISKNVVSPSDVAVLGSVAGQTATATLITCDPPGTSLNRLIIVGQQISPDPSGDGVATTAAVTNTAPATLPGNGPTLWTRVMQTSVGKAIGVIVIVILFILTVRWINKPARDNKRA
jgi:LPXTG-site transpeptidase (sortase) family protein